MLILFCLIRRNFRSSPKALKITLFFLILFILHGINISVHDLIYVNFTISNKQTCSNFDEEVYQIS